MPEIGAVAGGYEAAAVSAGEIVDRLAALPARRKASPLEKAPSRRSKISEKRCPRGRARWNRVPVAAPEVAHAVRWVIEAIARHEPSPSLMRDVNIRTRQFRSYPPDMDAERIGNTSSRIFCCVAARHCGCEQSTPPLLGYKHVALGNVTWGGAGR